MVKTETTAIGYITNVSSPKKSRLKKKGKNKLLPTTSIFMIKEK